MPLPHITEREEIDYERRRTKEGRRLFRCHCPTSLKEKRLIMRENKPKKGEGYSDATASQLGTYELVDINNARN